MRWLYAACIILVCVSCENETGSEESYSLFCGFERSPFVFTGTFVTGGADEPTFSAVGLHAKPDHAGEELNILDDVILETQQGNGVSNVIGLGDFNADCSYLSDSAYASLDLNNLGFTWLISKDADTNVASSSCAYDRILFKGTGLTVTSSGVDTAGITSSISDHYLVYGDFQSGSSTYRVAAFNLQRFGDSKASSTSVTSVVKSLVQKYDLVLLQELQGNSSNVLSVLPPGYNYVVSNALGSSSYKERYAYAYNSKVRLTESHVYSGEACTPIRGPAGSSCTDSGYDCGSDLYVTPGGQCRARNKDGENKRVKDCCCGI